MGQSLPKIASQTTFHGPDNVYHSTNLDQSLKKQLPHNYGI